MFSGIGGLELGLEWAGIGETVWQVESSAFCRQVLARHWPTAERFEDVRTVGSATLAPVDLICGGFPCQDVSSAGARRGLAGERSGLWREFARVVRELAPRWVVVENVASGAGLWFDAVMRELEQLGYDCLPLPLSAYAVGAPHRRDRLFIVAHADRDGGPVGAEHAEVAGTSSAVAHANSQFAVEQRRREARSTETVTPIAGDPDGSGREGHRAEAHARRTGSATPSWRPPVPDLLRVADGVSARLDCSRPRIAALGNAVVPQCAEVVGWVILELVAACKRELVKR